ncbi:hypothetical protein TIFTF001_045372 [Ficus carica]|uniref:Uncharacterized protein n=1 Tax=Ficus carica TaxID=3494 RepID=A0AA87Z7W5_FICCA|nr:hypothetical protein TIFTF001_045372 [Ficus carica]
MMISVGGNHLCICTKVKRSGRRSRRHIGVEEWGEVKITSVVKKPIMIAPVERVRQLSDDAVRLLPDKDCKGRSQRHRGDLARRPTEERRSQENRLAAMQGWI